MKCWLGNPDVAVARDATPGPVAAVATKSGAPSSDGSRFQLRFRMRHSKARGDGRNGHKDPKATADALKEVHSPRIAQMSDATR